MEELFSIDPQEWLQEVKKTREFFQTFGNDRMPEEITYELDTLQHKLDAQHVQQVSAAKK